MNVKMTAQASSSAPSILEYGIEASQDGQVDADVTVTLTGEKEESEDVFVTSPAMIGTNVVIDEEQDAASHSVEECQMGSASSFSENIYQAECDEPYRPVQAVPPAARSKKGKKKKAAKRKKSTSASKLPRRSSNRLRQKHEHVDFSRAPPKYHGPPPPSLRFCDYVISELLTSQYEPINWLLELQTVKRKLTYRQYETAEEFANEIRTWLYLPVDPDEAPPPPPVVLESVSVDEDVVDQNLEMLIEATEKAVNKVQSLILEVDSKRALLDDVRRKRRMAFSLGEDEPPVPQTLLQSTQVTMDKCEAMLAPPKEIVQPVVVKTENVDETAESVETTELPSAAPVELVDTADKTTTVPEPEDAGKSVPMTQQELIQLAKDLQRLSGEELQQVVIKSILKFHTLSVPECVEENASIAFENLTPTTLHEVRSHVSTLLDGKASDDTPDDGPLSFPQVDDDSIVEASYVLDEDSKERSSHAYDSSSESSSSSSELWMSSPSSDSCSESE
ncbi:unnamed protein product [Heligmosomoides polygyrus]|uniref:NET domain-containing protein n=1 Tax=Heligmosomoides polygyrus TaxID=6339 RepID=A0A3P7ZUJ3_HELPZ|nr:unnamed protein product [Heligmosomoides polygyrus]